MTICCVMAKAPRAGAVKTRLTPSLSPQDAARLATAFLLDTWAAAREAFGVGAVLSFAGALQDFPAALHSVPRAPQSEGDLGARIESAIEAGLARAGSDQRVLVIGSDLPGLSASTLASAAELLADVDACLGPSSDGGYYLIGARRWQSGMLGDLPWSASNTRAATRARLLERGYAVAMAAPFDDVDEPHELARLREGLASGSIVAPFTASALGEIDRT